MTRRHKGRALALVAALAAVIAGAGLSSCSPRLGWGLVLWTAPQGPLPAGSIVPVYIKSNIEKLYVVGVPGTSKKVELPLWQIELFSSRGKAAARLKQLGPNTSLYMVAARDGLPIRDSPTNNSSRVYRLREGQSVKILAKVVGDVVTTGGETLPGDWYQVMADDGTRGYVFSYAMRIYDETKEGPPAIASTQDAASARVDLVFSRSWRPEYFQEMLDDQRVDLDLFSMRYGLFTDSVRHQIRVELPTVSQVFNYDSISQDGAVFIFEGTPLRIRIDNDRRILATWTDDAARMAGTQSAPQGAPPQAAAPAAGAAAQGTTGPGDQATPSATSLNAYSAPPGSNGSAVFVDLAVDPRDAIRQEEIREQRLLDAFMARGEQWASPQAGKLALFRSGGFTWAGHDQLSPGFLPEGSGDSGHIAFRLFIDPKLNSWEGAFSLRFDMQGNEGDQSSWVNLLYRFTPEGLELTPAASGFSGITVSAADPRFEPVTLARAPK